jgi:NADP-dependent 3-hydroxy acid dehydrogenase YdfG
MDLHKYGVRVGMVSPAHVEETEFALVRFDGDEQKARIYEDFKPLSSQDVAASIYFMVTQPAHVNILDVVLQGTQQASSTIIDRSGRNRYEEEE